MTYAMLLPPLMLSSRWNRDVYVIMINRICMLQLTVVWFGEDNFCKCIVHMTVAGPQEALQSCHWRGFSLLLASSRL